MSIHSLISNLGTVSFLSNSAYIVNCVPAVYHITVYCYSVSITAVTIVDALAATTYCSEGILRMQYYCSYCN